MKVSALQVEDYHADKLIAGDRLYNMFGKSPRTVTGIEQDVPKPGHTTIHTDDGKSQWSKSTLPWSVHPRPSSDRARWEAGERTQQFGDPPWIKGQPG